MTHSRVLNFGRLLVVALALGLLFGLSSQAARAANPAPVQVYYVTEPEDDVLDAMNVINSAANSPMVSKNSIAVRFDGTYVYYDHWEDGFANDIANPTASEIYANPGNLDGVQIWGNGIAADGCAPQIGSTPVVCTNANDVLNAGDVIILDAPNIVVPNLASTIDWDGKDKIGSSKVTAVSRSLWASGSNSLFAWANAMFPTTDWGQEYTTPVGCDTTTNAGDMFEYTAFSITAAYDNTVIQVDPEGNGTWEANVTLNEGETWFDSSSTGTGCDYIRQGGKVRSTDPAKPIQVVILTGDIGSNYASRDLNLYPDADLSSNYYIPVGNSSGTSGDPGDVRLFIYNPSSTNLYVRCESPSAATTYTIAADSVNSSFTLTNDEAGHCFAVTAAGGSTPDPSRTFSGLATVDTASSGWDWALPFIPEDRLSNQALVGLGEGRDWTSSNSPTQNGSPLWVTPVCQTFFYVDWDNDGTADKVDFNGDNDVTDTNVDGLNETTSDQGFQVNALQSVRLRDASDRNQTGAYIYTRTAANGGGTGGCSFAGAWGEDPRVASVGSPGLDLGTIIVNLKAVETSKASALLIDNDNNGVVSPGDTIQYLISIKNTGLTPIAVSVQDDVPTYTSYVLNTTEKDTGSGWTSIPDDGSGTPFPLDDPLPDGVSLGNLPVDATWLVRFDVTVDNIPAGQTVQIQNCARIAYGDKNTTTCVTEDVFVPVAPAITVTKTANPTSIPETGGNVTFTYVVENTGNVPVTITSLVDDKFGPLAGDADCKVGTVLALGASCTFDAVFAVPAGTAGGTHTNLFTAVAEDGDGTDVDDDDPADVTYTDVLPSITVTKTANPTSIPETGGNVTFTYVVQNTSTVPVTITSLSDDKFGTLAGDGDCKVGTVIPAGGSCTFDAIFAVPAGNAGDTHTNVFTAVAEDGDGNDATDTDPADVTYTDVLPSITVTKTANPTSVPETGGNVTFTYVVQNTGTVPVTITSLSDDKFGTLAGDADCKVGTVIPAGGSCTFDAIFAVPAGNAGDTHTNVFTAVAEDGDGNDATDTDPADVTYTDVLPSITVTKTANPTSVPETGGNVTFTYVVQNTSTVPVTITSLSDDKFGTLAGDADCKVGTVIPAGGSCTFDAIFAVPAGNAGDTHTNVFTAVAEDGDGNDATDTDPADVTYTDVLPSITVTKTANPTSVPETGGNVTFTYVVQNTGTVPVTITSLSDDKFGTLAGDADCKVGTVIPAGGSCTFDAIFAVPAGNAGDTHTNVFTAVAEDGDGNDATDTDPADVTYTDVLPSITVTKTANPTSIPETGGNVTFTYVVQNTSTVPVTITSLSDDKFGTLAGDADCKVGTVIPAGGSCTFDAIFAVPAGNAGDTHTNVFTAVAEDGDGNDATDTDPADVTYTDVLPSITVTKTANPTSVPETGGNVTFTYVVQNTSTVPVTITSLSDDKFGTLAGDADCKVGTVIPAGGSCTFDAIFNIPPGPAGSKHTNVFTAVAEDGDGNEGSDDDPEDVTYTDVLPAIQVTKTANPISVPETGGNVTFTYVVQNTGTVPVTITSLSDDKFGTLAGDADCQVGTVIPVGGSCTFDAIFNIPPGPAGSKHTNVFTAVAEDGDGNEGSDDDPEDVTYTDVLPMIQVTKTANPTSVPETGGSVTFTYVVQNTGTVPVTITSLSDDKFGPLAGDADCQVGTVIPVGGSCTFDAIFNIPPGPAGSKHTNVFTAVAEDGDGNEGSDDDPEDVTYTDVLPSIIVTKTANPTTVPEAGGPVTFTYVVTNNGTVAVTITSLVDDKFGTLAGDGDCQVGTVIPAGGSCTFDAVFVVPPGSYPGSHVNIFTANAVDNEQNPVSDDDPAEVFYEEPPVVGICPVNAAANRWTDILGIGMGSPKKHKATAKIVIPNSGDVLALYGQLAAKDEGKANYVRFMYPGQNNYVQVNTITSPSPHDAAVFWYGTDLDPAAPNIRGRWYLQGSGTKRHIPRAMILYPTYQSAESYVDVFETFQTADTQVYWMVSAGWVPMQQVTIDIPAPLMPTTFNVKVAVVDNDKDGRPLFVTATAGGVSQTLQPTNPDHGDQLNILEFTLVNVPAGTSSIVLTHESIAPNSNALFPLGGDSGALVGVTANYACEPNIP